MTTFNFEPIPKENKKGIDYDGLNVHVGGIDVSISIHKLLKENQVGFVVVHVDPPNRAILLQPAEVTEKWSHRVRWSSRIPCKITEAGMFTGRYLYQGHTEQGYIFVQKPRN